MWAMVLIGLTLLGILFVLIYTSSGIGPLPSLQETLKTYALLAYSLLLLVCWAVFIMLWLRRKGYRYV